jgi:hypothetical protein
VTRLEKKSGQDYPSAQMSYAGFFLHRRWPLYRWRTQGEDGNLSRMDEGRKRVIRIMAAIMASLHMRTADDLFGGPEGSPRTDKLIAASVQWAELIMRKVDGVCGRDSGDR